MGGALARCASHPPARGGCPVLGRCRACRSAGAGRFAPHHHEAAGRFLPPSANPTDHLMLESCCFASRLPAQALSCGRVFKEDAGTFALDEIIMPECHPRITLDPTSHASSNIILTLKDIQKQCVAHGHELAEGEEYCLPSPVTLHLGAPSTAGSVHFRGTLRYRPAPGACDPDQFNRPATAAAAQVMPTQTPERTPPMTRSLF
ncbi:hypothetical protein PAPYR_7268 [Paratrimastix pyriformis]|uniref:Uncharacterized protein n=1 Tax=Paratrimastix pyriformis TaxID=342808 RepID=A0ABQ8UFW7_9EUKA|nr:hypothetical protein PAPYR_7268 [Paratrimastix pyriformis]